MTDTPARIGYRLPAEWEPHAATWIGWPHNRDDWPGKFAAISWVYAEIVRHLHRVEPVRILVNDEAMEKRAASTLARSGVDLGRIEFSRIPTDRGWLRDSGPIFIRRESDVAVTNWRFNAWAKYPDWRRDDRVAGAIGKMLGLTQWKPIVRLGGRRKLLVLEGGSIDVNGRGALVTTEECLLGKVQPRNPGVSGKTLERAFSDYLGVRKVIWLRRGISGDDTHGHVDDIARFVNPHTIVAVREDDPADENYETLRDNLRSLEGTTDQDGSPLRIVTLPMPDPVLFDGQRLPASYANFYIANRLVLVPTFNDAKDRVALSVLSDLFPDRKVVGIHAVDLCLGLGTLHCMTQQQPM